MKDFMNAPSFRLFYRQNFEKLEGFGVFLEIEVWCHPQLTVI
jgi:hypothetical protein